MRERGLAALPLERISLSLSRAPLSSRRHNLVNPRAFVSRASWTSRLPPLTPMRSFMPLQRQIALPSLSIPFFVLYSEFETLRRASILFSKIFIYLFYLFAFIIIYKYSRSTVKSFSQIGLHFFISSFILLLF